MTPRAVLLLVLDGISDRPCPELGGKTPLQTASTPVLDRLAAEGICGIMDTIGPGIRPGSDTSHLSLLGYPPEKYYTGRGPLEAEGCGIHMEIGMIGFRGNYATAAPDKTIIDRRAGRIHQTGELSAAIQDGVDLSAFDVTFNFRSGAGHRAALALKGEGLGAQVSSNDPKKEGVMPPRIRPCTRKKTDKKTADVCNEFIRQSGEILERHPVNRERKKRGEPLANIILLRGAGEMGHFESFKERYGLQGSVIAAATLIIGIGKVVGLAHRNVPGSTGSIDSNLEGKIAASLDELNAREFVLTNIKGGDEAAHDRNPEEKKRFIERIDGVLTPLLERDDFLLVICADHSTPCSIGDHSADPVPLLIHGEGVRVDRVTRFDEISCAEGGLHRIRGISLMPILLDLINKAHKYGA
ncbi:MAG: 2,3-bisphosphoglycerate-independent phosphoglycerate mutase [Methanomicrobiales archaeon]|nr:2,3-bisphosphoglycerate-independent phosphoglycerate mutase [Methanomicrobiales archaeon]